MYQRTAPRVPGIPGLTTPGNCPSLPALVRDANYFL